MSKTLQRNLKLLKFYRGLSGMLLIIPVIVLFFNENGLSQTDIFLVQSIFAVTALLFEVPSGYLADRFGRRTSLLAGALLWNAGVVVYIFSYGFWQIAVAEVILGLAYSFISGADSALAYDTHLALGTKQKYRRFESMSLAWMSLGSAIGGLIGGALAIFLPLRGLWVCQLAVSLPLIVLAWSIKEPPKESEDKSKELAQSVLKITKYALHGHTEIKWLILYGAVAGCLTHTVVWLYQPLYQQMGIAIGFFGALWAAQVGVQALFARSVDSYERRLGKPAALVSFILIGASTYLLIGFFPFIWMLPALLGFSFVRAVFTPIVRDYVNELVESSIRATVLSVQALAQRLLYISAGPLIGWTVDAYSLSTALIFSAALYGCLGTIVLLMMRRNRLI